MAISVWYWVIWGMFALIVLLVVGFWLYYRSYNFKVRIRDMTSTDVRLIFDTVAKIKKDEDGVEYLGLFKKKGLHDRLPLPKPDSIDYDPHKKKKVIEAWYSEESGYVYIMDGVAVAGFQPLNTKQRQMLVHQIRKKEERKSHSWMQNIPLIVGSLTLVAILALLLIFTPEIYEAHHEVIKATENMLIKAEQILDRAVMVESGQQVLGEPP